MPKNRCQFNDTPLLKSLQTNLISYLSFAERIRNKETFCIRRDLAQIGTGGLLLSVRKSEIDIKSFTECEALGNNRITLTVDTEFLSSGTTATVLGKSFPQICKRCETVNRLSPS
jgi:hypothetical protein